MSKTHTSLPWMYVRTVFWLLYKLEHCSNTRDKEGTSKRKSIQKFHSAPLFCSSNIFVLKWVSDDPKPEPNIKTHAGQPEEYGQGEVLEQQGQDHTDRATCEVFEVGDNEDEEGYKKTKVKWNLEFCKTVCPEVFDDNMEENNEDEGSQ